ncbi:MAG: zf-HC2 domain-containing protein [Candidatus Omnitrophota bacterium]
MHNEINMSCDDIKKKLQPFLDDLLAEDEYKAFSAHIDNCGKCSEHVRSIGALSNQLWKLGKVRVPEDLGSTIMYKLTHPKEKTQPSKFVISKKHIVIGSILVLLAITAFFGINYFRNQQHPHDRENIPIIRTEIVRTQKPPSDSEAQSLLKQLEIIAAKLGISGKDKAPDVDLEKESVVDKKGLVAEEPQINNKVVVPKIRPLHWHFCYSQKVETAQSQKEIQRIELRIEQELKKKEALNTEIEHLREQIRQTGRGQHYSEDIQETVSKQKPQLEVELQKRLDNLEELDINVKHLEEEKQKLESALRQSVEEKRRNESERKRKLFNALTALGIGPDYQKHDVLVFTGSGEKIEGVIEQILFISENSSNFRNFTTNVLTVPDKENRVSIYLEHDEAGPLHWHIDPIIPSKKTNTLDIIKELSNTIDYESDELLILSIPEPEIEKLRNRIQATGVSLSEYGSMESQKRTLSSGPVTISIYFTK